jgi:hypothetical protein
MLVEAGATGVLLVLQSEWLPTWALWGSAGLLGVVGLSTLLFQEPMHAKLTKAHDPALIGKLIATNWIRTIAWTARCAILAYSLWMMLEGKAA